MWTGRWFFINRRGLSLQVDIKGLNVNKEESEDSKLLARVFREFILFYKKREIEWVTEFKEMFFIFDNIFKGVSIIELYRWVCT